MSRFNFIDKRLTNFAKKFQTELSDGRDLHRKTADIYEERRICWTESNINRMILISPFPFDSTSEKAGSTWNFINVAWLNNSYSTSIPMWEKFLIYKVDFELIITHIDELLKRSEENLTKVTHTDLRKSITRQGRRIPGLQK